MSSRLCLSPRMTLAGVAIGLITAASMLLAEQNPTAQRQTSGHAAARTRPLNADAVLHSAVQRELHAAMQQSGGSDADANGNSARETSKGWTRTSVRSQSPTFQHDAWQSMLVTRTQQPAATGRQDSNQHNRQSTAQPVIQLAAAETPAHDEHRAPSTAKSDVARKLEQFYSRTGGPAAERTNSHAAPESTGQAEHLVPAGGPTERTTPPAASRQPASPPLLQRLLPFSNRSAQRAPRRETQAGDATSSQPSRSGPHLHRPHHRATANRRSGGITQPDSTASTRSPQTTDHKRPGLLPEFNLFERLQDGLPKPIAIQRSASKPPLPAPTKTAATQQPQTIHAVPEPEPDPISRPEPAPAASNNLADLGNPFPEMSEAEADLLLQSPFTGLKLTEQDVRSASEPGQSAASTQEQKVADARPEKPAEQSTLAAQRTPIEPSQPSPSQTQRPSTPAEEPRLAQKQTPIERPTPPDQRTVARETKPAATEAKPTAELATGARRIPADLLSLAQRNRPTPEPKPEPKSAESIRITAPSAPIEEPTFAHERTPEPGPQPAAQRAAARREKFLQRTIISARPQSDARPRIEARRPIERRHEQPIKHATPPNDEVPAEPKATQVAATAPTPEIKPSDEPSDATQFDRHSKMARIAERKDQTGFKGFCPVALRDRRDLLNADGQFTAQFETRTYTFSSAEAKATFDADPEKYAPAAAGYDVILLLQGQAVEGSLDHAVWFRDRLYLFSSRETLQQFTEEPAQSSVAE